VNTSDSSVRPLSPFLSNTVTYFILIAFKDWFYFLTWQVPIELNPWSIILLHHYMKWITPDRHFNLVIHNELFHPGN
jgi:hypothetical protein